MSQKILDYFGEYNDEISRASDNTIIGVSINGFTASDNFPVKDIKTASTFRTTQDFKNNIPYYIKIGTGKLDDSLFGISTENAERTQQIETFYNDPTESYYDGQYYSTSSNNTLEQEVNHIYDIDKPLFRVQLGEYEVQNSIKFQSSPEKYTTLQFAVMRRVFNDFVVKLENAQILNTSLRSYNIFSFNAKVEDSLVCKYLGLINDDVDVSQLKAPDSTGFLNYYAIPDGLSYIIYNEGTGKWEKRRCVCAQIRAGKDKDTIYFVTDKNGKYFCQINDLNGKTYQFNFFKNRYYAKYEGSNEENAFTNKLSLGVTDIVKGSFNSTFILRENLFTNGYEYSKDGMTVDYEKPVENVSLTEDYIYCDENNKVLYTYNNGKKLMIYQENNKYFKNIINNVVKFEKEETFSKTGIVENYFLNNVPGFNFDIDKMSLNDRILSFEKIKIRNEYHSENEPILFSNFVSVKPYLRGIFFEDNSLDISDPNKITTLSLNFGYKFKMDPKSFIQKSKFQLEEKKLRPYNKEEEYQYPEDLLEYNVSKFEDKTVSSPTFVKATFTDEQNIIEGFEY